jgi:hypothetical protein
MFERRGEDAPQRRRQDRQCEDLEQQLHALVPEFLRKATYQWSPSSHQIYAVMLPVENVVADLNDGGRLAQQQNINLSP